MPEMPQAIEPVVRPPRNRRRFRSHLVNRDVRLRLVLDDALFALIAALTAIGILYYMSNREIGDSLYSAHLSIKDTRELLTSGVKTAGIVTFFCVLAFGFWSMIDAHRIAGPMHRLRRLLRSVGEGNLTHEIRFRRRDEFHDVADAADRMVDALEERVMTVRRIAAAIDQGLQPAALTERQLADLRRQAADLSSALAYFRLPADGAPPSVDGSLIDGD